MRVPSLPDHVARKRKRNRTWLRTVLLFVFLPFLIWAAAFVSWLYWDDISRLIAGDQRPPPAKPSRQTDKPAKQVEKPSKEKIPEEDRRKLDEILKKRS